MYSFTQQGSTRKREALGSREVLYGRPVKSDWRRKGCPLWSVPPTGRHPLGKRRVRLACSFRSDGLLCLGLYQDSGNMNNPWYSNDSGRSTFSSYLYLIAVIAAYSSSLQT